MYLWLLFSVDYCKIYALKIILVFNVFARGNACMLFEESAKIINVVKAAFIGDFGNGITFSRKIVFSIN